MKKYIFVIVIIDKKINIKNNNMFYEYNYDNFPIIFVTFNGSISSLKLNLIIF